MTEHDFSENAERYSEYRKKKKKLFNINGDLRWIDNHSINEMFKDRNVISGINIEKYSEEAKNGLKEYLKTMMLAEIERAKKRMEEI